MKIKRIKTKNTFEIDVKRFYIPFLITEDCPSCGRNNEVDFTTNYLSYPTVSEPIKVNFYCYVCEHEWSKQVKLEITLKEVKEVSEETC